MLLLVQYTLIFASVLILVALGGCFSEHSGVINLGLEGIMVIGALGGALAMRMLTGAVSGAAMVLLVLLAAIVFGVAYSALLGVASINFKADQTLVGTALNLLGTAGATGDQHGGQSRRRFLHRPVCGGQEGAPPEHQRL